MATPVVLPLTIWTWLISYKFENFRYMVSRDAFEVHLLENIWILGVGSGVLIFQGWDLLVFGVSSIP